jgi:glutamate-1-semialdehyde 2,1-aminomutase
MELPLSVLIAAAGVGLLLGTRVPRRLQLSLAKHPSLRGHSKWSRRLARLVPYYALTDERFFACDGAPQAIAAQRRAALARVSGYVASQSPRSLEAAAPLAERMSDVGFTSAYRVPFPFREALPASLRQPSLLMASSGTAVRDLDGNWRQDLSGAYGVNVFGYDFYKSCIDEANELARPLGPVLGPYHPVVVDNAERLAAISGLDEVSFHMSGTEAVMQAVRLARYNTGRSHLVRFCGAYHGWWDGVQPGVGNERRVDDVYTLADMSERSLRVIASRRDIACVLVNPLQALNPNADAPTDGGLLGSRRTAHFDRAAYTDWLQRLRRVCTEAGVVLIFDEVLTGFRLHRRGAQGYFGIQADLVTYGKTLGGGLPIGALAGRAALMRRFDPERPARVSLARGTFNCHPYVMAAMNVFLRRIEEPPIAAVYESADGVWEQRRAEINDAAAGAGLPLRFEGMHSIWTVIYTQPSRYNWMYQFYLRAHGLELAWIGSGRFIFSLNFTDEDFGQVRRALLDAAAEMQRDGWWWGADCLTHRAIRRQLTQELLTALRGRLLPARRVSRTTRHRVAAAPPSAVIPAQAGIQPAQR